MYVAQAKEDAEDAVQGKGGCCGAGIYTEVYDPSKSPPEHPNLLAARHNDEGNQLTTNPSLDDFEEKDDDSFDRNSDPGKTTPLHPAGQGQQNRVVRKMDSLVYTDSDSDQTGQDNNASVVRKVARKLPGGKPLPGMSGDEDAEANVGPHERSIGGHHIPRTLPARKREDSEDDDAVFEEMGDI